MAFLTNSSTNSAALATYAAINASILWAKRNHELSMPYIKEHAQELENSVINDHICLYVNSFSEDLGPEGMAAIEFFLEKGKITHEVKKQI